MFITAASAFLLLALVDQHPGGHTSMSAAQSWMLMHDGSFTLMLNRQGGPRGETELRAPNWWMGMASRRLGRGTFVAQAMLTLEPATVGKCGYAELFQVGETCHGRPLFDRQHPHDLTSQLAVSWKVPVTDRTSLVIAGGPVAEPALGPVAYMHRPSSSGLSAAPLSHHTFDSTHVAMGAAVLALDRAPFIIEGSVFNGREPNENRWNLLDRGAWDCWSARIWYRPAPDWHVQVSSGHLVDPEAAEPGNIQRTTASVAWFSRREDGFSAIAAGYGRNAKTHDTLNAMFAEATHRAGRMEIAGRFEALQVETDILARGIAPVSGHLLPIESVVAVTGAAWRDVVSLAGVSVSAGADLTIYRVPPSLVGSHGAHPVSFHVSVRLRPSALMGRMWDMTMTGLLMPPMSEHRMPGM